VFILALSYEETKETFVSMAKVRDILEKIKEKNYEQKLAHEHVKKFAKLEAKKADALVKELSELEMRKLKDEQIIKIVDLMPTDVDDLKVILSKAQVPFKEEELVKIIEIVKKHDK
jgi:DNA-directed RNA polymerase subunit F